jgi:hypothetical protein
MRNSTKTSSEASSTVEISGSFGIKNGVNGDNIGGATPSTQNSGLRRFIIFGLEFLLFFLDELKVPEAEMLVADDTPLFELVP